MSFPEPGREIYLIIYSSRPMPVTTAVPYAGILCFGEHTLFRIRKNTFEGPMKALHLGCFAVPGRNHGKSKLELLNVIIGKTVADESSEQKDGPQHVRVCGWTDTPGDAAMVMEEEVRRASKGKDKGLSSIAEGWKWETGADGELVKAVFEKPETKSILQYDVVKATVAPRARTKSFSAQVL
jgi:hypothetical protein